MLLLDPNKQLVGVPVTRLLNEEQAARALHDNNAYPLVLSETWMTYEGVDYHLPWVSVSNRFSSNTALEGHSCFSSAVMKDLRDAFRCHYTGRFLTPKEATDDHVIPRSRPEGRSSWLNNVTAYGPINWNKSNRTPEEAGLTLLWEPWALRRRDEWDLFAAAYGHMLPEAVLEWIRRPETHMRDEVRRSLEWREEAVSLGCIAV